LKSPDISLIIGHLKTLGLRSKMKRLVIYASISCLVFLAAGGCVVNSVNQPSFVEDGLSFHADVNTSVTDSYDVDPLYTLIAIMLPEQFTDLGGSWDAGPHGYGNLVDVSAQLADDVENEYDAQHPLPGGYKWVVYRTDDSFDPDGGLGDYIIDYALSFVAHNSRTGEDYTMSYATGVVDTITGGSDMGYESDQSWDNPIVVGYTGINADSLGGLKVRFRR
jgi:hypothetical protein